MFHEIWPHEGAASEKQRKKNNCGTEADMLNKILLRDHSEGSKLQNYEPSPFLPLIKRVCSPCDDLSTRGAWVFHYCLQLYL